MPRPLSQNCWMWLHYTNNPILVHFCWSLPHVIGKLYLARGHGLFHSLLAQPQWQTACCFCGAVDWQWPGPRKEVGICMWGYSALQFIQNPLQLYWSLLHPGLGGFSVGLWISMLSTTWWLDMLQRFKKCVGLCRGWGGCRNYTFFPLNPLWPSDALRRRQHVV